MTFTKDELKHISKEQATTLWYAPPAQNDMELREFQKLGVIPDTIYMGTAMDAQGPFPTWEQPVYSMKAARTIRKLKVAGKEHEITSAMNPWFPEFRETAREYDSLKLKAIKEGKMKVAGIGTNAAWSGIDVTNVYSVVLGLEFEERSAVDALLSVNTPSIELNVDVGTPYEGHEAITEGVSVEPNRQTYTSTTFDLPKNIAFFGMTDEAGMKARHNVYQLHVENAPKVQRKIENGQAVTIIESATNVSAGDWGAFTSGLSDRNPLDDIRGIMDTITSNGGSVGRMRAVVHNKVWTDFIGNTFIKGAYNAQQQALGGPGRIVTSEKLPFPIYIDNDKTNSIFSLFAEDAIIRANGPTMTVQYRDENRMVQYYKNVHFTEIKLVQSGRARDLTSVTA